jgi:2-desacetyl-2-hydroxyethyl bacteriochlorophyllide A dehydrogenase
MQALIKYAPGPGSVELRDVPEPVLGRGDVLISVAAVGVCGTDRLAVEGAEHFPTPRILGHEVSGVVEALGPDTEADGLAIGDHVTLETDAYVCGVCHYCAQGENNRCPHRLAIGTTTDGGMAERIAIRRPSVHRLPEGVSLAAGALIEPLSVAVHSVIEQGPPVPGEVVVVTGPGAVGLLVAQVARAVGATVVLIGRERHAERLAVAKSLGIEYAVDGDNTDVKALVDELSDGVGAYVLYECSGGTGIVEDSIPLLQKGARIVLVAFFRTPPVIDIDLLINRELELVGSRGKRSSDYRRALRLVADGQVALEPLITARLPLSEWREGLELMSAGEKVVFEIGA